MFITFENVCINVNALYTILYHKVELMNNSHNQTRRSYLLKRKCSFPRYISSAVNHNIQNIIFDALPGGGIMQFPHGPTAYIGILYAPTACPMVGRWPPSENKMSNIRAG